jgi:hypothetical protein
LTLFINKMRAISIELGFWAQTMIDAANQHTLNNHMDTVLKRMIKSVPASSSCDPARATTKGLRNMTFVSSPFVDPLLLSRCNDSFEADQEKLREFFHRNHTPARVKDVNDDEEEIQVPVHNTTAPSTHSLTLGNPPPEFYAQLIKTMKHIQAPQQPTNIFVESRDHEETIDLAKLQNRMLQLMYATGNVNWDDGTVKNI